MKHTILKLGLPISLLFAVPVLAAKGGRGGNGTVAIMRNTGVNVFTALLEKGIKDVQNIPIQDLKSKLENAEIVPVSTVLYEEDEYGRKTKVDALNYSSENKIEVSEVSYPFKSITSQTVTSVHEAIGLLTNSDIDKKFAISRKIVTLSMGPTKLPSQPEKKNQPEGTTEWKTLVEFPSGYQSSMEALLECERLMPFYKKKFRDVLCQVIPNTKIYRVSWNEVHESIETASTDEGHVDNRSGVSFEIGGNIFLGSLSAKMSDTVAVKEDWKKTYRQTRKPIKFDLFRDEVKTTYTLVMHGARPLILNTEPDYLLFDSAHIGLIFESREAARNDCAEYLFSTLRRLDYKAHCQNMYEVEDGKFAYQVVGKPKYVQELE